jgi:hypothetical protein
LEIVVQVMKKRVNVGVCASGGAQQVSEPDPSSDDTHRRHSRSPKYVHSSIARIVLAEQHSERSRVEAGS